jgi:putative membrane protein
MRCFDGARVVQPLVGELTTERGRQAFLGRAALVRTAFASEQSLLAWIRTSVSLFSCGFALSKFFSYLADQQEGLHASAGPHRLGIALVCVGLLVLVLAVIEHAQRLRRMSELGLPTVSWCSLPICMAVGILTIGVSVLAGFVLRWPF